MPGNYYLPPNEGNEIPWRWLFFDCESISQPYHDAHELQTLDFGYALLWVRERKSHPEQLQWYRFTKPLELVKLLHSLAQPKQRLIVCAHNIQYHAALAGLIPNLRDLGWHDDFLITDTGKQLYKLHCEDRSLLCVDSYNWLPFSLAEIGARIGLPKLDMPPNDAPQEEKNEYCKRDVDILFNAVKRWTEEVANRNLGNFAFTIAGQAFNAFRHRFNPAQLLVDRDQHRTNLARQAYYGGRTECYTLGTLPQQRYTLLDVNSLYASVMHRNKFPVKAIDQGNCGGGYLGDERYSYAQIIATVDLETDKPYYPYRKGSHLVFPIGRFRTTLAGPELFAAIELGHVAGIHDWVAYDMTQLFTDYVEYFYEWRKACNGSSDSIGATIAKLFLNTLYGKFGQRSTTWHPCDKGISTTYKQWDEYDCDTGEWRRFRTIGDTTYQESEPRDAHFAIPSIAAFVTSYARQYLLWLIELAGWEHVYYVDTDSLLVDSVGLSHLAHLVDGTQLGRLKVVDEGTEVHLHGLKNYSIDGRRKAAGLKRDSRVLPDGSFSTQDFWGITHNWSAGLREGVIVHHYVKSLSSRYAKGIVGENGAVTPLVLTGE